MKQGINYVAVNIKIMMLFYTFNISSVSKSHNRSLSFTKSTITMVMYSIVLIVIENTTTEI